MRTKVEVWTCNVFFSYEQVLGEVQEAKEKLTKLEEKAKKQVSANVTAGVELLKKRYWILSLKISKNCLDFLHILVGWCLGAWVVMGDTGIFGTLSGVLLRLCRKSVEECCSRSFHSLNFHLLPVISLWHSWRWRFLGGWHGQSSSVRTVAVNLVLHCSSRCWLLEWNVVRFGKSFPTNRRHSKPYSRVVTTQVWYSFSLVQVL